MCKESLIDFSMYKIYNDGKIWSVYWNKYINTSNLTNSGYAKITLKTKNKKYKTFCLHRVIWYYFNGEIPDDMEIGHKDCKPQNNALENLYLCTHKENMNHPTTRKKLSEMQKGEKGFWYGKVGPMKGHRHTEETKKRISILKKGL